MATPVPTDGYRGVMGLFRVGVRRIDRMFKWRAKFVVKENTGNEAYLETSDDVPSLSLTLGRFSDYTKAEWRKLYSKGEVFKVTFEEKDR
jgi:hypothetical protein